MTAELILYFSGLGIIAGFVAGLLGVGGGLIIVPVLVVIFQQQEINPQVIVHMAIATSLATIVFTSISSIYAHHYKYKAVRWDIVIQLSPGIIIGALLGAVIADYIKASSLQRFFGIFELIVAIQMAINFRVNAGRKLPGMAGMLSAGTGIGSVSSIVGIGGGTLTVPFLSWCNIKIQNAVATSSACGLPIAIAGCIGFILTGLNEAELPVQTIGYVYWPALVTIVVSSIVFAPAGAWLAHRLSAAKLKRAFSLALFLLAMKMLSV